MADLVEALDLGASLTKIWDFAQGQKQKLLLMEPEVIQMDIQILIDQFDHKVGQSKLENLNGNENG